MHLSLLSPVVLGLVILICRGGGHTTILHPTALPVALVALITLITLIVVVVTAVVVCAGRGGSGGGGGGCSCGGCSCGWLIKCRCDVDITYFLNNHVLS